MKTKIITLICVVCLSAVSVMAKSPVRCLSSTSLGVEYICLWRGQNITKADVPSHEQIQQFAFNYAPFEYLQFLIGLGMDRFRVDTYVNTNNNHVRFRGNYGFSFAAAGYVNTPAFKVNEKDILRFTGGCDILFLNSKDNHDYKYSGPVINPHVGLLAMIGPYFDMEAGVRWHFIDGKMRYSETDAESPFSNNETMRGYFAMTLASNVGAYAKFNFDVSQETTRNWQNGPREASIGFAVGFVMKTQRKPVKKKEKSTYFPKYEEMKEKQEKMIEELGE